jgi:hypothetical protein
MPSLRAAARSAPSRWPGFGSGGGGVSRLVMWRLTTVFAFSMSTITSSSQADQGRSHQAPGDADRGSRMPRRRSCSSSGEPMGAGARAGRCRANSITSLATRSRRASFRSSADRRPERGHRPVQHRSSSRRSPSAPPPEPAAPPPGVLDEVLPQAFHSTEAHANKRFEADHGRPKARSRPTRGAEEGPNRKDHGRRACLHAETPERLLRTRRRDATGLAARQLVRGAGPRDLIVTPPEGSAASWIQSTQQRRRYPSAVGRCPLRTTHRLALQH